MTTQVTINIDDYLTEDEKKTYAIDAFKEAVKKELFKSSSGTVQSDSEVQRIIGNITSAVVFKEVQNYIPDFKEKIIEKVREQITDSSLRYEIFKKKDAWQTTESKAITYIDQTVKEMETELKERIKKEIREYDLNEDITNSISNTMAELGSNLFELSELLIKKSEK